MSKKKMCFTCSGEDQAAVPQQSRKWGELQWRYGLREVRANLFANFVRYSFSILHLLKFTDPPVSTVKSCGRRDRVPSWRAPAAGPLSLHHCLELHKLCILWGSVNISWTTFLHVSCLSELHQQATYSPDPVKTGSYIQPVYSKKELLTHEFIFINL